MFRLAMADVQSVTPGEVFLSDVGELLVECDTDEDGTLDKSELRNFLTRNLQE